MSSNPSLLVGISIKHEAKNVARSAPQEIKREYRGLWYHELGIFYTLATCTKCVMAVVGVVLLELMAMR